MGTSSCSDHKVAELRLLSRQVLHNCFGQKGEENFI